MAETCLAAGVNVELAEIIRSAECLMHDSTTQSKTLERESYNRDLLDIQNLFSAIISRFVQWNVEHSSTCSPIEGVLSICLVIYMCFVMRGKSTVYGPLPSCLNRLQPYFNDSRILRDLRRIGLDVWVGLLVVIGSAGHHDFEDMFFRVYLETVIENDIQTFDELQSHLRGSIWISRPMDVYAWEIWRETPKDLRRPLKLFSGRDHRISQPEYCQQHSRQRQMPAASQPPISLLGFPAFKLDHTDFAVTRDKMCTDINDT